MKTKKVTYVIGVNASNAPITVEHVLECSETPKMSRAEERQKSQLPDLPKKVSCDPQRGLRAKHQADMYVTRQSERRFQKAIKQSFDDGQILFLEKNLPINETLHPEVSFIIVKGSRGYGFKGCNGNTVARELFGLTGGDILKKVGHNGSYIHSNGVTGTMETLEGALAVCRFSGKARPINPLIVKSFDGGEILLVEEAFLIIETSLPRVSFVIIKNERGYLFKGCNGNTVARELWGLRGRELRNKTGHNGSYIHPDGSTGIMERLSGALAICRGCNVNTSKGPRRKGYKEIVDYNDSAF